MNLSGKGQREEGERHTAKEPRTGIKLGTAIIIEICSTHYNHPKKKAVNYIIAVVEIIV